MKLSSFLLLLFTLPAAAAGYSQKDVIKVTFQNGTISDVIEAIETQTEYKVFYKTSQVDVHTAIKASVEETTVASLLDKTLKGSDLTYSLMGKIIVLEPESSEILPVAQSVTGKVTDEKGDPIPGVSVLIKGTTTGTVTDIDGKYKLAVDGASKILIFSYIGMIPQEITVGSQTVIDVVLKQSAVSLDEIVVVGYGTIKKSDITGAVSSVKSLELKQLPTQRVDQALQGRVAGVMVLNTDGAPGGNTTIRVRGMNSINGGNSALIVIDGLQGADINTLDPNDIESMEILKDASSTAIYGSRGANGVILITTKGGQKGRPSITYSGSIGMQTLAKKLDLLNAYDYATLINENRMRNDLITPIPIFTDMELNAFKANPGTDWQNEIYRTAPITSHTLSLSGGNDNTSYYFSAGYLNQDGIVLNTGYKRYNIRGNINTKVNKFLKAGINLAVVNTIGSVNPFGGDANATFYSSAVMTAMNWPATLSVYDNNGNYTPAPGNYGPVGSWNPVANALETTTKNYLIDDKINTYLEFDILKGLQYRVSGTASIVSRDNETFFSDKSQPGIPIGGLGGYGIIEANRSEQYQFTNILTYDKNIDKHHFTIIGVYETQLEKYSNKHTDAKQFAFAPNGLNDLGGANVSHVNSYADQRVLESFLGRVQYSFADKYLLTASIRRDGSSVFGANNKWANFPSVAIGWKASEESFMKDMNIFSNLKIRGSWGITGNQGISPYQSLASLGSNPGAFNYPYDGTLNTTTIGYLLTGPANPNLKWETTKQVNIGLDFGFFQNRLVGSIDVFNKVTTDLLMFRRLASYTGFAGVMDNVGEVGNKGLELSLGGDPVTGEFTWHTNGSFSWLNNEILSLGSTDKLNFVSSSGGHGTNDLAYLKKGGTFGSWYGYTYLGTWKESERQQAKLYGQLPGDSHYLDSNSDTLIDSQDIGLIGTALPTFIFGWTNNLSYKGFDLTFLFQGVSGNDVFNTPRIKRETPGEGTSAALKDHYTAQNETDIPAFNKASAYIPIQTEYPNKVQIDNLHFGSTSRWVENGAYVRLKNITLAYNLPTDINKKLSIQKARVYISATNLLTFSKYQGYDPEVSSYTGNDASMGIDFGNYPTPKVYTLGLEVTF